MIVRVDIEHGLSVIVTRRQLFHVRQRISYRLCIDYRRLTRCDLIDVDGENRHAPSAKPCRLVCGDPRLYVSALEERDEESSGNRSSLERRGKRHLKAWLLGSNGRGQQPREEKSHFVATFFGAGAAFGAGAPGGP